MHERAIGLEVEYSIAHVPTSKSRAITSSDASELAYEVASGQLNSTQGSFGEFRPNGGRLYYDAGHLEWATPECRSAREVIIYDRAGEHMMEQIIPVAEKELARRRKPGLLWVGKTNVDSRGNTFGCHENYLTQRSSRFLSSSDEFFNYLVAYLVPFLVTRTVTCGSGRVASGRFHLSQRADFINQVTAEDTRVARAIVNTRDEAHSDPSRFRRLHLILGDANMAEWATYLKVGTTALVLEMIEELFLEEPLELADPVKALHSVSEDPTLKVLVPMKNRTQATPLQIQDRYLTAARKFFGPHPDDETREVLEAWDETLRKLRQNPKELVGKLDWVTKQMWMQQETAENVDWNSPIVQEMDWKYHSLHSEGNVFHVLKRAGLIHSVVAAEKAAAATESPPLFTRARIRSEALKRNLSVSDWSILRLTILHRADIELRDPLDWCPAHVLFALGLDQTEFLNWVKTGLEAQSYEVRCQALRGLGESADRNAPMLAAKGLEDPDYRVRATAAETLRQIKDGRVVEALQKATGDPHFLVRFHAVQALEGKGPSTPAEHSRPDEHLYTYNYSYDYAPYDPPSPPRIQR